MRYLSGILAALLLAVLAAPAAGQTISVFSPFTDGDFAEEAYIRIAAQWQKETGNRIDDYTGGAQALYPSLVREGVEDGTADIVIIEPGSGLDSGDLVPVEEMLAASPQLGARVFSSMREADGSILLSPIRLEWEALFVNEDVLARFGLEAPASAEELLYACRVLSAAGVRPLANAPAQGMQILLDCAALMGAPEAYYGLNASLEGAQALLEALAEAGAFGMEMAADDGALQEMFIRGGAAMRFDSSWLARQIAPERHDCVAVVSPAGTDGRTRQTAAGKPGIGLAITRACWEDDARREAALSFAAELLAPGHAARLSACAGGRLGDSIAALSLQAQDCAGRLCDLLPGTYALWEQSVLLRLSDALEGMR